MNEMSVFNLCGSFEREGLRRPSAPVAEPETVTA
jgi:hypothetical protein